MDKSMQVGVTLRPMGTPLPLGFLALAAATTLFSALQLGWLEVSDGKVVAIAVLTFTVPLQVLASVYGYAARDAVAGTGMGLLAGTWAAAGFTTLTSPPGSTSAALGTLFLVSALSLAVPAVAAAPVKMVPALVIGLSAIRFALTGAAQIDGPGAWRTSAGVVGIALAALAVYAALALELEDTTGRTVLPVGRRGAGQNAIAGSLGEQLEGIEHEAGVRQQL